MKLINLSKSQKNYYEEFSKWLHDDLNSVNAIILENLKNDSSLIAELSNYIIGAGGKRIRPLLTLAMAKLCGYSGKRHLNLAAVIHRQRACSCHYLLLRRMILFC